MTKKECEYVLKILERITNPDEHIEKAKAYIKKDIAHYNTYHRQLKDNYESDYRW